MSIAKNILRTPLAVAGLLVMAMLFSGPSSKAQTIPSDPRTLAPNGCADIVTPAQFANWFQTGTPSLNGVVKPADSLNFPGNPNCDFYTWSEQMFLWLTSPAPSTYCGGGAHVFCSPALPVVSPLQNAQPTSILHAATPLAG